jgi:hypothetical protein
LKYIYYIIKFIICFSLYIAIFFMFPEISAYMSAVEQSVHNEILEIRREMAPGKSAVVAKAASMQPDRKILYTEAVSSQNAGDIILPSTSVNIHYYNQSDPRWGNNMYGPNNTISVYGCGPTALAMVVTSLTGNEVDPLQMAQWAYENGYFCQDSGSYHSIIPEGASKWGLTVSPVTDYSKENLQTLLSTGSILVALMGNGHFTENGHFILIRGVTLGGNFLIADPVSLENSQKEWPPSTIIDEAKYAASSSDGPVWAIKYIPE